MSRPLRPFEWLLALALITLGSVSIAAAENEEDFASEKRVRGASAGRFAREARREAPPRRATDQELAARAAGSLARQTVPLGLAIRPMREELEITGPGGLDWNFLGPAPMTGDYWSAGRPTSGRVSCVATHPTTPSIAYIAAAQGGVWKTTDSGASWTVLTDGLPTLASGWVEIDPATPNKLYYGTGELHYSGDSFYGDGIFKSTDGGASWSKLADNGQVGSYIARVKLKPGAPSTIYVAGSDGVVRSTDSGGSWTSSLGAGSADDLIVHASTPALAYASINQIGLFKSTDSGVSWTQLGGGLPVADFGRINLAIAATNANVLFASVATPGGDLNGLYKSTDAGVTWAALAGVPNYLGGQGWYDNAVAISPTNENIVFAAGIYPYDASLAGVIRSTNGGTSWTDVTNSVHPDQHHLAFAADGALWLGNDGGVWRTTNLGNSWSARNTGLGITQFYTVGLHPSNPSDLLGGTQDNGTVRYTGVPVWPQWVTGDGGPVVYERDNPNIFYQTYVFLWYLSKFDDTNYLGDVTGPWQSNGDNADWCNGPLIEDPNSSGTLYVGTYRVYKSPDSGGSWNLISPSLAPGGVLLDLAVAVGNSNRIYSASDNGRVFVTDDGAIWNDRSVGLPSRALTNVLIDPDDEDRAYVSVDQASGIRVMRTTDAGLSWSSMTGDLPNGLRGLSLAVDFRPDVDRLYLGTDYGVYASLDAGSTWVDGGTAMPDVAIYELKLDTTNDYLVAATHGRSMWRAAVDLAAPDVSVSAPDGGEVWNVGSTHNVTWAATDLAGVSSVDVVFEPGGAGTPVVLASAIANSGTFAWSITQLPTTTARVRVIARDPSTNVGEDTSDADFTLAASGVGVGDPTPTADALHPVRSNPGRAPFEIRFALAHSGNASLELFDAAGRRVRVLGAGMRAAGEHLLRWDGRDDAGRAVRDGLYFYRLRSNGFERTLRLALIR
ncbi:MAG: hypothetical protein HOP12_02785 [Candidatus Eisenbacteria bacterium]|uniref:FlgD/Vpr Ig-like domain-containing protein n=1 Tax=Eiseniibacteriota bacterium TaxID=2212470 RepID=A0A849SF49_UNCEI|nr:hypothetical protein [Candidatus Eisenbacteria bacterium]